MRGVPRGPWMRGLFGESRRSTTLACSDNRTERDNLPAVDDRLRRGASPRRRGPSSWRWQRADARFAMRRRGARAHQRRRKRWIPLARRESEEYGQEELSAHRHDGRLVVRSPQSHHHVFHEPRGNERSRPMRLHERDDRRRLLHARPGCDEEARVGARSGSGAPWRVYDTRHLHQ